MGERRPFSSVLENHWGLCIRRALSREHSNKIGRRRCIKTQRVQNSIVELASRNILDVSGDKVIKKKQGTNWANNIKQTHKMLILPEYIAHWQII